MKRSKLERNVRTSSSLSPQDPFLGEKQVLCVATSATILHICHWCVSFSPYICSLFLLPTSYMVYIFLLPTSFFVLFIAHLISVSVFPANCPSSQLLQLQEGRCSPLTLQATHSPPLPVLTSQAFQVTAEIANFGPKTFILLWKRKTKSINVNSFDISARYCANWDKCWKIRFLLIFPSFAPFCLFNPVAGEETLCDKRRQQLVS